MSNCCNLYFLSTLACKISDSLTDDELSILAADVVALGDMLAAISVRNSICSTTTCSPEPTTCNNPCDH